MQRSTTRSILRAAHQSSTPLGLDELPRTTEQAEAVLTEHVLGCRHCLAVALYRMETLAEVGCREYKALLNRAKAGIQLHLGGHVETIIGEEYSLDNLATLDRQRVEVHISACTDCANIVCRASAFVSYMKAALLDVSWPSVNRAAAGSLR
jgi:hypothetical protein